MYNANEVSTMKPNRHIGLTLAGLAMAVASCTDFADYNEAYVGQSGASMQSLWANISANDELSDFAKLLRKAGYDEYLSAARTYTVFAPLNGTYNSDSLALLDSATLASRFVENHVANYNYQLSGTVNERIHTLNEKSFVFDSSSGGTFAGVSINEANQPSLNGTMHTLNGYAPYYPNVYEYIFDVEGCDSIQNYFYKYHSSVLDEDASVEGPIDEDGNPTYSDSVMVETNTLFNSLRALLNEEDSSYTMLIPTDDAFNSSMAAIQPCYNYTSSMYYYSPQTNVGGSPTNNQQGPLSVDADYLNDSVPKNIIARNLIYSENDSYNAALLNGEVAWPLDTIHTTTDNKLSDGYEVFDGHLADGTVHEMSNGHVRIVDSLVYKPWEVWNPEIVATYRNVIATGNATSASATVTSSWLEDNYSITYFQVEPSGERTASSAYIELPNVRSTTYNVYVVLVGDQSNPRPYSFGVDIMYANSDGSVNATSSPPYRYGNTTSNAITTDDTYNLDSIHYVDTVLITNTDGEAAPVTFPVSYYGLDISPYICITTRRPSFGTNRDTYEPVLRIASVILRPVEYDEFLKTEDED